MAAAVAALTVFTACQGPPVSTATPVKFNPTPAPASSPATTATPGPAATRQPTVAPAQAPVGNAERGRTAFNQNGCSGCHRTDPTTLVGPGLGGVYERAATRVAGLSAERYIEQSIREPGAFIVPGFPNVMLTTFKDLPAQDIADLIAYLRTLK